MTAAEFWKEWAWNDPDKVLEELGRPPVTDWIKILVQRYAEAYLAHRQAEQSPRCPKCGSRELDDPMWRGFIHCGHCGLDSDCIHAGQLAQFFGQAEEWIPVSGEKLPEITEAVLVHSDGFTVPVTARYLGDRRFSSIPGKWEIHAYNWQPLPSPPKQKG